MAEEQIAPKPKRRLVPVIVAVGVAGVMAISGFAAAWLTRDRPQQAEAALVEDEVDEIEESPAPASDFQYYEDIDVIIVNLHTERADRFMVAKIILAIRPQDFEAAKKAIDAKKPELLSWVNTHLSDCKLGDAIGARNRQRLAREIKEEFNEVLWPGKKPRIDHVLFKDFKIQ